MNGFDPHHHHHHHYSMKRRWQERRPTTPNFNNNHHNMMRQQQQQHLPFFPNPNKNSSSSSFSGRFDVDGDLVSTVVPPVTVVLEGRSICQRISLHNHASYHSLVKALRQMFVEADSSPETDLDLSNAVPGHLVAYEDMENDLLLAGDLNWKDFVRVAKRIRIVPAKGGGARKEKGGRGGGGSAA